MKEKYIHVQRAEPTLLAIDYSTDCPQDEVITMLLDAQNHTTTSVKIFDVRAVTDTSISFKVGDEKSYSEVTALLGSVIIIYPFNVQVLERFEFNRQYTALFDVSPTCDCKELSDTVITLNKKVTQLAETVESLLPKKKGKTDKAPEAPTEPESPKEVEIEDEE